MGCSGGERRHVAVGAECILGAGAPLRMTWRGWCYFAHISPIYIHKKRISTTILANHWFSVNIRLKPC